MRFPCRLPFVKERENQYRLGSVSSGGSVLLSGVFPSRSKGLSTFLNKISTKSGLTIMLSSYVLQVLMKQVSHGTPVFFLFYTNSYYKHKQLTIRDTITNVMKFLGNILFKLRCYIHIMCVYRCRCVMRRFINCDIISLKYRPLCSCFNCSSSIPIFQIWTT